MLTLNTPALLFPALSLILLAYNNRFTTLSSLVRNLHARYQEDHDEATRNQINNLRLRIRLIRDMQGLGILSMLLCVICMYLVYRGHQVAGDWVFGAAMVMLIVSLGLSVWEIWISTNALQIQLHDLEEEQRDEARRKRRLQAKRSRHREPVPGPQGLVNRQENS